LERAVRVKGLQSNIVFTGQVQDTSTYWSIADAMVLPSHSEGSPNVLLEAMAAGVPVIATAVGGVPEIAIAEESAILVSAHSPQLLADALHRVLTDPQLAQELRANARARVRAHFTPESAAQSLIQTYQELLPNKKLSEPQAISN
jgi:glycosyltransferase involved in cell wall biosynthesis